MAIEKLKVFISWSGERSRAVARALRDWLPDMLPLTAPWMSVSDIEKGTKWSHVISGELEASDFAVICLTPENLDAAWLLFEAGAVAKKADSHVCTYLIRGLDYTDVKHPLSQFQHTTATKEDTLSLIQTINNNIGEGAMEQDRLIRQFERCWPDLEAQLNSVPAPLVPQPRENEQTRLFGMVKEILETVREHNKLHSELNVAAPPLNADTLQKFDDARLALFGTPAADVIAAMNVLRARRPFDWAEMAKFLETSHKQQPPRPPQEPKREPPPKPPEEPKREPPPKPPEEPKREPPPKPPEEPKREPPPKPPGEPKREPPRPPGL